MRINQVPGNTADHILLNALNAETSASAPRGTPMVLTVNGTNDGLAVVLPSTATAAKTLGYCIGVATNKMDAGTYQDLIAYGVAPYVIVKQGTRAASSDSWTSSASLAALAVLAIDTVNNCFVTTAASLPASNYLPFAIMAGSVASFAASATATSDARTVLTASVKAFLRFL